MDETLLKNLIYISQVSLFAGIAMLIFAWVEKKVWIEKAGHLLFVAMGVMAVWIILNGNLTLTEPADGNMTKEVKTIFFLFGLIATSVTSLAAYILRSMKSKFATWLNIVLVVAALLLFFLVYELIKA